MSPQDKLMPTEEMIEAGRAAFRYGHLVPVKAIYLAMEAARQPMKIIPADPVVLEDDTGAYSQPSLEVQTDGLAALIDERIGRLPPEHDRTEYAQGKFDALTELRKALSHSSETSK